jgi:hypothetical protein
MGQYFLPVNLTKKQYLHPHHMGEGLKFGEFPHTILGLTYLLADGEGMSDALGITGSWAGDQIVIIADYAEKNKYTKGSLYEVVKKDYENISHEVLFILAVNNEIKTPLMEEGDDILQDIIALHDALPNGVVSLPTTIPLLQMKTDAGKRILEKLLMRIKLNT